MSKTAENPKIGLDNVVIAPLISDVGGMTKPVYGAVIPLRGAVTASVNPNSSVETDYADNGAFFVANNRANVEMTLELTNVDPATIALMLGQKRQNGITVETPLDQSPYFALGFRVWIGGVDENGQNIYEYFWYAKGKFSVPESGGNTRAENIDFQHISLTAQFVQTFYQTNGKGVICTHARTDYDMSAVLKTDWFNAPVVDVDVNLSAISLTIAKSGSVITVTGSKADGSEFAFASDTVTANSFTVVDEDGNVVTGELAVSESAVSPTITFTASSTLEAVTVALTGGIKDTNGVAITPKIEALN